MFYPHALVLFIENNITKRNKKGEVVNIYLQDMILIKQHITFSHQTKPQYCKRWKKGGPSDQYLCQTVVAGAKYFPNFKRYLFKEKKKKKCVFAVIFFLLHKTLVLAKKIRNMYVSYSQWISRNWPKCCIGYIFSNRKLCSHHT